MVVAACGILLASAAAKDDSRKAKSRYFMLAGAQKESLNDHGAAFELYKRAYELDNENLEAAYHYGVLTLSIRDLEDESYLNALALMQKYVEAYPDDEDEVMAYATVATHIGEFSGANKALTHLLEVNPDHSKIYLSLSFNALSSGDMPAALSYLDDYERLEGASDNISSTKIGILLSQNKPDTVAAIAEARRFLNLQPNNPDAYCLMGSTLSSLEYNDSALVYLLKAEELAPNSANPKYALANFYNEVDDSVAHNAKVREMLMLDDLPLESKLQVLQDYSYNILSANRSTESIDSLISVLTLQYPHEPEILSLASQVRYAEKNYAEAESLVSYAMDLDPNTEKYLTQIITCRVAQGKHKEAVEIYEQKAAERELSDNTRYMALNAYVALGDTLNANRCGQALLSTVAPGLNVHSTLSALEALGVDQYQFASDLFALIGESYRSKGDNANLYRCYENALTLYPANTNVLNNYAYYLALDGGDLQKCLEMSLKSNQLDPDNIVNIDTLAWIYFLQKDYPSALATEQKLWETVGDDLSGIDAEYFDHYGDILFFNGSEEEALAQWRKALTLEPDNDLLQRKVKSKSYIEK